MSNYQEIQIPAKIAAVLATTKRFKVCYGGRGAGRSWSFSIYCLLRGTREPLKILCCREVQNTIRDSSHALLSDWIAKIPYLRDHYTIERDRIYGKNGTEILFKGLKEQSASHLKSLEGVDLVFLDEAAGVSHRSWQMLIPTIRKDSAEFLIAFNPETPEDPVVKEVLVDRADLTAAALVNYYDNPFLPASLAIEARTMEKQDPDQYRHVWLGEVRNQADNQVISYGLVQESIARIPDYSDEEPVLAVDPAGFGADSNAFVVRHGNLVLHKSTVLNMDDDKIAAYAIDLAVEYNVAHIVVDVAGGYGLAPVRQLKEKFPGNVVSFNGGFAAKSVDYANKRTESWFRLRDWLKTGRIPNDLELSKELTSQTYGYNSKSAKLLTSKAENSRNGIASPNLGDALAMSLCVDAKPKPKPQQSKIRPTRSWSFT